MQHTTRSPSVWGRSLEVTRDPAGGWLPLGAPGNLDLVSLASEARKPVVWLLDLEVVDTATGQPPADLLGSGFLVSYGAGSDSREHLLPPGIHALIGIAIRVRVVPPQPSGYPIRYRYSAHCTWTEAVPPSYVWIS